MSEVELMERLRAILGDVAPDLDVGTIGGDQDLRNDVGLDSMDFLNFMIGVSKQLNVAIPEADYGKVASLAACARYVEARTKAGSGPRPQR